MLLSAVFLFLGTIFAQNVTQEDDLQIIGSDNHYSYQPSFAFPQESDDYQGDVKKFEEKDAVPEMNYPVKTVQRYKDQDGNVRVITSYSNKDDNPLPIYKDKGLLFPSPEAPLADSQTKATTIPVVPLPKPEIANRNSASFSGAHNIEPRMGPKKMEYSAIKSIRFPNNDGELIANEHETSVRDGGATSYNHRASYNTKSKKPLVKVSTHKVNEPSRSNHKVVNQPLEVAGSSYVSDVDDGEADDVGDDGGGVEYSSYNGGGDYEGGGYNHGGGHQDHGAGYAKSKGNSYAHGHHESKGEKGGKGHKSDEHYEKGHSEKHGHEGSKGDHKEESGEKAGHHDEANTYAKGHHSSHGGKKHEKGHTKGHKKGHKTKGFRTVHHKDEYKKDEVFYDEEHDAGHQKGHGHDHSEHKKSKGGHHKKGHLNSGYKHGHKGLQGDKEHGHSYKNSKGHSNHAGHKSHGGHHSHYSKGAGHKDGESHAKGHGGHY